MTGFRPPGGIGRGGEQYQDVAADSYPDLLERLFAAFEDRHALPVIEDVAARCRSELTGQTPAGAHFELLERLIRQRLTDMAPTRPTHPGG